MVSNALKRFQQPVAITAKRQNLHCSLEALGSGLGTAILTEFSYLGCMEMVQNSVILAVWK